MKIPRNHLIILFLLMLIGGIWRAWNIGIPLFHVDERFTFQLVQHDFWYILWYGLSQDCNPPLYYILDHFSLIAFGANAFAERLPALISGILLIPAAYFLGMELRNDTLGLLSAILVASLGSMWYYSGFGRAYSMICLFFTLTLIVYIKLLRGRATRQRWILYGLMCTLCLWTHLYALVPIAFMTVYLWYLYGWGELKQSIWGMLPSIPLLGTYYSITTTRNWHMGGWMGNTIDQLVQYMPLEYFGYACGLMFPLIGISTYMNRKDRVVVSLVVLWLLTFIAQLGVSVITPVFIRYSLLMVPMLCVIAMEPVMRFLHHEESTTAQKLFVMIVFVGLYFAIQVYQITTLYYAPMGWLPVE